MTVTPTLTGIHHVTAITADAQKNIDFYCGVLGLRLVKLTVNFDDSSSYHLYYGDESGRPGTIMTFFAWPGAPRSHVGPPQVTATAFAVPAYSLDYWASRLKPHNASPADRLGERAIRFTDPDGITLPLAPTHGFRRLDHGVDHAENRAVFISDRTVTKGEIAVSVCHVGWFRAENLVVNRFAGHRLLRDRPQLLPGLSPSHSQRLSHCPLPVAKHWNVAVVIDRYEVITSKKALREVRRNHRVDRDTQGCRPPLDSAQWRLVPREGPDLFSHEADGGRKSRNVGHVALR